MARGNDSCNEAHHNRALPQRRRICHYWHVLCHLGRVPCWDVTRSYVIEMSCTIGVVRPVVTWLVHTWLDYGSFLHDTTHSFMICPPPLGWRPVATWLVNMRHESFIYDMTQFLFVLRHWGGVLLRWDSLIWDMSRSYMTCRTLYDGWLIHILSTTGRHPNGAGRVRANLCSASGSKQRHDMSQSGAHKLRQRAPFVEHRVAGATKKRNDVLRRKLKFWDTSPIFWEKSPIFWEKNPIFWAKKPYILSKKPYILRKEPARAVNSQCVKEHPFLTIELQWPRRKSPMIWVKSLIFWEKSPKSTFCCAPVMSTSDHQVAGATIFMCIYVYVYI